METLRLKQNTSTDGCLQENRLEAEDYAGALSNGNTEWQTRSRAASSLMEQVVTPQNLRKAIQKVKANHEAPGIDGITVDELEDQVRTYYRPLVRKLRAGTYKPQPVKRVFIPKPDGTRRQLGIPRVLDRMVQQAIYQVLMPVLDGQFSTHSYGFRPHRSAQMAIQQSEQYWNEGYRVAVSCDLKSYFDTINHQRLMAYLEHFVSDQMLLKLIWRFLHAGLMKKKHVLATEQGTPQGGNLSPLLANLYLDQLDKELERRGHRFVRYADDFRIYVKSRRAGERVLASITRYLEDQLKLTVNRNKSKVGSPMKHAFLSFQLYRTQGQTSCFASREAKQRMIRKLKRITRRNRPGRFAEIVKEVNQAIIGWINYFAIGSIKSFLQSTREWLNHRLRQLIWKRWKRVRTRYRWLRKLGIDHDESLKLAASRKGYWRLSRSETMHRAVSNQTLTRWGLKDWLQQYERLHVN